jgi:mRNA interferase MazF
MAELDNIFDIWNEEKKTIANKDNKVLLFREGEIWWCCLGQNLGNEINGKAPRFTRPILVLRKLNNETYICLPLTTKQKVGSWYFSLIFKGKMQTLALHQIRMLHSKRLQRKWGTVSEILFMQIKEKLRDMLELP